MQTSLFRTRFLAEKEPISDNGADGWTGKVTGNVTDHMNSHVKTLYKCHTFFIINCFRHLIRIPPLTFGILTKNQWGAYSVVNLNETFIAPKCNSYSIDVLNFTLYLTGFISIPFPLINGFLIIHILGYAVRISYTT